MNQISLFINKDIHSAQDISPELIRRHIGHLGWINPEDNNDFGVNGKVTDTWYFGLNSMSSQPDEKSKSLLFEFSDSTHTDADMRTVCVALDDYMQPLVAAGFAAESQRNRFNEVYWTFTRNNVGAIVYLRGKSHRKDTQTCVSMAIISASS